MKSIFLGVPFINVIGVFLNALEKLASVLFKHLHWVVMFGFGLWFADVDIQGRV